MGMRIRLFAIWLLCLLMIICNTAASEEDYSAYELMDGYGVIELALYESESSTGNEMQTLALIEKYAGDYVAGEWELMNWVKSSLRNGSTVKASLWKLNDELYYAETIYHSDSTVIGYALFRYDGVELSVSADILDPGCINGSYFLIDRLTGRTLYEGGDQNGQNAVLNALLNPYGITVEFQTVNVSETVSIGANAAMLSEEMLLAESDGFEVVGITEPNQQTENNTAGENSPTEIPAAEPTAVLTPEPTAVPTAEPTAVPAAEPTAVPTAEPTAVPTPEPTAVPTAEPTAVPTPELTAVPTPEPTAVPTPEPTPEMTAIPIQQSDGKLFAAANADTEVRVGPGADYPVLMTLKAGISLEYLGIATPDKQGAIWYAVSCADGTIGWVSAASVSIMEIMVQPAPQITEAPALPVAAENSISRYYGDYAVEASSYRYSNEIAVYGSCALDNNLMTAWNTNEQIIDEWLKISTKDGRDYQIGGLRIASGYWKNKTVYAENSRPRTIDVYCDDIFVCSTRLADEKDYQLVWFEQPVTASSIRIVICDGYRGDDYEDCCVTEVDLLGPGGITLSSATLDDWGAAVRMAENRVSRGERIARGDSGMAVLGLQLLLKDGFGILEGNVDGAFGGGTQAAVEVLAGRMMAEMPDCEPMPSDYVDAAYWRNMLAYMDLILVR